MPEGPEKVAAEKALEERRSRLALAAQAQYAAAGMQKQKLTLAQQKAVDDVVKPQQEALAMATQLGNPKRIAAAQAAYDTARREAESKYLNGAGGTGTGGGDTVDPNNPLLN